jgi:hypothetical protein
MKNISEAECKKLKVSHTFTLKLAELERFNKMPQMIPWVGENYGINYKKLLLIGESHYLSYASKIQLDAEKWYSSISKDLHDTEIAMTFTRKVLSENFKQNSIWRNTAGKFKKVYPEINQKKENIFVNFAFYNYFQRPAEEQGKSINVLDKDKEEANKTFLHVIDVLEPDIIIFTSSKAWRWGLIVQ